MQSLSALSRVLLRLSSSGATGTLKLRGRLSLVFEDGVLIGFVERRQEERRAARPRCTHGSRRKSDRRRGRSEEALVELLVTLCREVASERAFAEVVTWGREQASSALVPLSTSPLSLVIRLARSAALQPISLTSTEPPLRGRFCTTRVVGELGTLDLSPTETKLLARLARGSVAFETLRGEERAVMCAWLSLGLVKRAQAGSHAELLSLTRALRRGDVLPSSERRRRRQAAKVHPDRFDPELKQTTEHVMKAMLS